MTNESAYRKLKDKHKDAMLLLGAENKYIMYFEDAQTAHEALGLRLTGTEDKPQAWFPRKELDIYLPKLIRARHRVCICDAARGI